MIELITRPLGPMIAAWYLLVRKGRRNFVPRIDFDLLLNNAGELTLDLDEHLAGLLAVLLGSCNVRCIFLTRRTHNNNDIAVAVLVGEADTGRGLLHDFLNLGTLASDDLPMELLEHWHFQLEALLLELLQQLTNHLLGTINILLVSANTWLLKKDIN